MRISNETKDEHEKHALTRQEKPEEITLSGGDLTNVFLTKTKRRYVLLDALPVTTRLEKLCDI